MTMVGGTAPDRIRPAVGRTGAAHAPGAPARPGEFARTLDEAIGKPAAVRFSGHALDRIRARGIQLSQGDLEQLGRAVDLAASRGGRESLVVSRSLAYVVNVPSRTVVTAMAGDQVTGSVFTNIDSAVVL